jgi:uncharacterized protein (DUF1697 family)
MPRYAALLRGINVGRNKRIAMADLRALVEGLGCTDVRTLLVSGNIVLTSPARSADKVATQIEGAIAEGLGMSVRCLVRTPADLRAVIEGHPFTDVADNGSRMFAHFLSAQPSRALLAEHDPVALDPEWVRVGPKVIYQWCPNGLLEAPNVNGPVEKLLGVTVTSRNWNTVTKLSALLGG